MSKKEETISQLIDTCKDTISAGESLMPIVVLFDANGDGHIPQFEDMKFIFSAGKEKFSFIINKMVELLNKKGYDIEESLYINSVSYRVEKMEVEDFEKDADRVIDKIEKETEAIDSLDELEDTRDGLLIVRETENTFNLNMYEYVTANDNTAVVSEDPIQSLELEKDTPEYKRSVSYYKDLIPCKSEKKRGW